MKHVRLQLIAMVAAVAWSAPAQAQLFGGQTVGTQAISGNFPGGATATIGKGGAITPNSRFVRTGRQPTDFVGTDSGDRRRFVGSRQAGNRRPLAPTNLAAKPEPNVNQSQTQTESNSATSLYPPRLVLGDELTESQPAAVQSLLQQRLQRSQAIRWTGQPEISVEGRTAILRGTVASTKDRALAQLLVELEPGVSYVQNDLLVKPAAELMVNPPALPASPQLPQEF